jgi:hypothetical protein
VAGVLALAALGAVALHLMGRRPWCAWDPLIPWAWNVWSAHNSQHLIDPYTVTHAEHGVLAYAVLRLVGGGRWPAARALVGVAGEVLWEVAENTTAVIEAYRESTMALGYEGDSVVNSLGDVLAFALGYTAAMLVPAWRAAVGVLVAELALLLTIRDGLLLNVLMLLHPIDAIRSWQVPP